MARIGRFVTPQAFPGTLAHLMWVGARVCAVPLQQCSLDCAAAAACPNSAKEVSKRQADSVGKLHGDSMALNGRFVNEYTLPMAYSDDLKTLILDHERALEIYEQRLADLEGNEPQTLLIRSQIECVRTFKLSKEQELESLLRQEEWLARQPGPGKPCAVCGEFPHRGDCPTLPPSYNYGMPLPGAK
jgi:hypothetical protein